MSHQAYLLTGSNRGSRRKLMERAARLIAEECGPVMQSSQLYLTQPWGFQDRIAFLNQVHLIETNLEPPSLLETILQIETSLGRNRSHAGYTGRTMDIDILFFDDLVMNTSQLVIPHPCLQDRRFVLEPLAEIAPGLVHPLLQCTISVLLANCTDPLNVQPFSPLIPSITNR